MEKSKYRLSHPSIFLNYQRVIVHEKMIQIKLYAFHFKCFPNIHSWTMNSTKVVSSISMYNFRDLELNIKLNNCFIETPTYILTILKKKYFIFISLSKNYCQLYFIIHV